MGENWLKLLQDAIDADTLILVFIFVLALIHGDLFQQVITGFFAYMQKKGK